MTRGCRPLPEMVAVAGLVAAFVVTAPVAAGAQPLRWGIPTSSQVFGRQVEFHQPLTADLALRRAEVLIRQPRSVGPHVSVVPLPAPSGSMTLVYDLGVVDTGLVPNTPLEARWRIIGTDGTVSLGPVLDVRYVDDRFEWQTATGSLVRLHWYAGGLAFGRRALQIGEEGITTAESLLGVTETEPVDVFVYADQGAFDDALGPGTPEAVGGEAFPEIRTVFALIPPGQVNAGWVGTVIPHELTHVVFDTGTFNPYHRPPHWLDEGIATYVAQGDDPASRAQLRSAIASGTLMPLDALAGAFPLLRDRFYLAYAESVSAVAFLLRRYGTAALARLVRAYGTGAGDEEAFRAALGVDVAGFQAAWLADLGARAASAFGPRPAPPGPVPSDWRPAGAAGIAGAGSPPVASPTRRAGSAPLTDGGSLPALVVGTLLVLAAVGIVVAARGSAHRSGGGRGGVAAGPPATMAPTADAGGEAEGEERP